jgi:predicted amino acid racemase
MTTYVIKKEVKMYPQFIIDTGKLRENAKAIISLCKENGIGVTGVVKAADGDFEIAKVLAEEGCERIASSRLYHLRDLKERGINSPLALIRIPMLTECSEVVRVCDMSLNSDINVLRRLSDEAERAGVKHKVVLMLEMGDLREGIFEEGEYLDIAAEVEEKLDGLHLLGTGMNVGCYGSIVPTPEKIGEFVAKTEKIEAKIGRRLEMLSGGASTAIPRLVEGNMPERVNNLRIGEAILINKDNEDVYGTVVPGTHRDVFTLKAEVVEKRTKPTHPIGEIGVDAFRQRPTYEDRGNRERAIVAVGKVDYGYLDQIVPQDPRISVVGASSDHTLVDIEDAKGDIKIGDILTFDVNYAAVAFLAAQRGVENVYA